MAPPLELTTVSNVPESEPLLVIRKCPVNASDIELKFQSSTDREFLIRVEVPNGEKSQLLHFAGAGQLHIFIPSKTGCGHGDWQIEMFQVEEGGIYGRVLTEKIFADGMGSLFFSVGDDLKPVLVSHVWSHLPENASCRQYRFFGGGK